MANENYLAVYDYETDGINPEVCQPLSLGVVLIHPKKLELVEGGEFYSLIKPEFPEKVSPEALKVNKLKMEDLMAAPELKTVWNNFVLFLKQYKKGKNAWGNPIACGWNIANYDNIITTRLAKRFGSVDKEDRPDVFHPRDMFDAMLHMFHWFENREDIRSYSFDNMRQFLGLVSDGEAHNALTDSKDAARVIIRLMKMYRRQEPNIEFAGAFANDN